MWLELLAVRIWDALRLETSSLPNVCDTPPAAAAAEWHGATSKWTSWGMSGSFSRAGSAGGGGGNAGGGVENVDTQSSTGSKSQSGLSHGQVAGIVVVRPLFSAVD
jgi:hypothetical protein